jgi:lysophospholipase L1-like esterase
VVIQVDSEHQQDVFIHPLKANVLQNDTLLSNPIHVLDLQQLLTDDHYYLLDRHLNAAGHAEVGRALSEFIASLEVAEQP